MTVVRTTGLLVAGLVVGVVVMRAADGLLPASRTTTINQSVVVQRLESVAKLVTAEAMLRDVVTYRQTWLGSTKRTLVIVTGKAMVGVDLRVRPRITVNESDKRVALVFPRAQILGIDITDLRTYDEQRGLWNPFHPADRDSIFQLARVQLAHAAQDLAVLDYAERSARLLMQGLFTAEGWTVDVTFEGARPPAASDGTPD